MNTEKVYFNFKLRVFVEDLRGINALRVRGGHYMFGDSAIGHDLESALLYLKDPKNQDLRTLYYNKKRAYKKTIKTKKTEFIKKISL